MNIFDYTYNDLSNYLVNNGYKKYNANQIFDWVYKKRIFDYNKMTNLSKDLVVFLEKNLSFNMIEIEKKITSEDVVKYLFKLNDNHYIETVLMKHDYGNSLCISTQVGCNMGCVFCQSGKVKKIRNLTCSEMVLQVILVICDLKIRIDNVVVMGIGEPFDNYNNVMKFVNIINDNKALNIASRKITISTCGIVPKIIKFANEKLQINLAISLHATQNKTRNKIMPINKVYPIEKLLDATMYYIKTTNRRVTIEYIMLNNINDSTTDAYNLAKLFKNKLVYINLISYNKSDNFKFSSPKKEKILKFYDILKKENINVTIRKEFGSSINAACGQLRANKEV